MTEAQKYELDARRETIAALQRSRAIGFWTNLALLAGLGMSSLAVLLLIIRR